jgi:leader peptidase (prepilin peptidase)/N-methyltransferase
VNSLAYVVVAAGGGVAIGLAIRWLSVKLARHEELEPGFRPWQVYGPPVVCALLFATTVLLAGTSPIALLRLLWIAVCVQVIFFDFEQHLILDWIVLPAIAAALAASFVNGLGIVLSAASGILVGGTFWAISIVSGAIYKTEALGLGDVKFTAFIGCVLGLMPLGFPAGLAIVIGLVLATLVALPMMATGRLGRREAFPLGPFLAIGTVAVLLTT